MRLKAGLWAAGGKKMRREWEETADRDGGQDLTWAPGPYFPDPGLWQEP